MSKRSERRKRQQERRKKTIRESVVAILVGIVFIALGAFGMWQNNSELREYKNSDDIRDVQATIVKVDIHDDPEKNGSELPRYIWDAKLEFMVGDSPTYTGEVIYDREVQVGEVVTTQVYRKKDGSYAVAHITNETRGFFANIPMYLGFGVGGIAVFIGAFLLVSTLREK